MTATQSAQASFASLAASMFGGVMNALGDRAGLSPAQKQARETATVAMIMAFLPRDGLEMMFASQAVMFHELAADAAHDVLSGLEPALKLKAQSNTIAMGRLVHENLDRLLKLRARPAEGQIEAPVQEHKPDTVVPFTEEELIDAGFPPEEAAGLVARARPPRAQPLAATGKPAMQLVAGGTQANAVTKDQRREMAHAGT